MPMKNPLHPGGFVLQYIEPLGLTITRAAWIDALSELVNGKSGFA
jgi:plasmid maintenance system antidote protein VapI